MTTKSEPAPRAVTLALVAAEAVFVGKAVECGEPERCALGQVALLRRVFEDPGERLEAYVRLP
jgi:hypothetical protein